MRIRRLPLPDSSTVLVARPVGVSMGLDYSALVSDDTATLADIARATAKSLLAVCVEDVEGMPYGEPYPEGVDERAKWWLDHADFAGIMECANVVIDGGQDVVGKPEAPDA